MTDTREIVIKLTDVLKMAENVEVTITSDRGFGQLKAKVVTAEPKKTFYFSLRTKPEGICGLERNYPYSDKESDTDLIVFLDAYRIPYSVV